MFCSAKSVNLELSTLTIACACCAGHGLGRAADYRSSALCQVRFFCNSNTEKQCCSMSYLTYLIPHTSHFIPPQSLTHRASLLLLNCRNNVRFSKGTGNSLEVTKLLKVLPSRVFFLTVFLAFWLYHSAGVLLCCVYHLHDASFSGICMCLMEASLR